MSRHPEGLPDDPFPGAEINLPFQALGEMANLTGAELGLDKAVICGGVTLKAAVLPVPGLGNRPALIFQFHKATGRMVQPIVFVTEKLEDFPNLKLLTYASVNAALKGWREIDAQESEAGDGK